MKQLTQQLKSGKMEILEVPFPSIGKGEVLVRNHYSVISAGTEGYQVTEARKGYIAKAKSRKKEVQQVIESIKTNGIFSTYTTVINKLEAPSPLGYSCMGEVISVDDEVTGINVGDFVTCGGKNASHADVVSVPKNLCAVLPIDIDKKQAAFATIGSIAIQGIRRADLQVGCNCVVIGLGLIGQITMQILKASGIYPIGIDIQQDMVDLGKKGNCTDVFNRNQEGLEKSIYELTNGFGTDAVIITAGTKSNDPVELAGRISRQKGKVVIVGAVPTGYTREHYYNKELDLRISKSYGPGRYDAHYEEKGIDYPIGYARFTENRNMQTFISLLANNQIDLNYLITHEFELLDAPKAYEMILNNSEYFAGIVVKYAINKKEEKDVIHHKIISAESTEPNVGLIGAGNFAQNVLLPHMKGKCNFIAINTNHGNNSSYVAKKYNIGISYDNARKVIEDNDTNTIFVLTRHDTHAKFVIDAIKNKKHVFVEKPLAINTEELESIRNQYNSIKDNKHFLMVGFNRRFSPYLLKAKSIIPDNQPISINIRINSGSIPMEHWVNDKEIGGGRIIGEACHFIDLAMFIADSNINSVSATAMDNANGLIDTVSINLKFNNGSIANILYFSNGNKIMPKELIEIFSNNISITIDDFKKMTVYGKSIKKYKYKGQDKGHQNEIDAFFTAIKNGYNSPIPFEELYHSTLVTFKVLDSIRENRTLTI